MGFVTGLLGAQSDYKAPNVNVTQQDDLLKQIQAQYAPGAGASTFGINQDQAGNLTNEINANMGKAGGLFDQASSNYGGTFGQQQTLANALSNQAYNPNAPSLAQMQLQQALNQSQTQNASAINSQKGINPGTAARTIQESGNELQGNMATQGAMARLQEQMMARQALGQQLSGMAGQSINQQQLGQAGQLQGLGLQSNLQNAISQNSNNRLGILQNALSNQNQAAIGASGLAQQTAAQNAQINANVLGQTINSIGGAASLMGGGGGGGGMPPGSAGSTVSSYQLPQYSSPAGGLGLGMAMGGGIDMKAGGHVPGKAKVEGDDPKNDTVPAVLSPGEIVIPRTKAKDPEAAKAFVEAIQKRKKSKGMGYGGVVEAREKCKACGGKV